MIIETFAAYRKQAETHLTSHALADFRQCPQLYYQKKQGLIPDEDRPAYVLGRAAHKLILEGKERFAAEYVVGGPVNPKTGKVFGNATQAYEIWAAAQGRPVITDEQYALIVNLSVGVRVHEKAAELLAKGIAEGVVRGEYCGRLCQSRIDWTGDQKNLVDFKTCEDLTYFNSDAKRYGYMYQLAFYRAMYALSEGVVANVHLIAVEKRPPYRCGVWLVSADALDAAQNENESAIRRLGICENETRWPTGFEEMRIFDGL